MSALWVIPEHDGTIQPASERRDGEDRRQRDIPHRRPRVTDLKTGERIYRERRHGERRS